LFGASAISGMMEVVFGFVVEEKRTTGEELINPQNE
jgi:hypothetical protein